MLKQIIVTQCNVSSNRVTCKRQLCVSEAGEVSQRKRNSRKAGKSSPRVIGFGEERIASQYGQFGEHRSTGRKYREDEKLERQ